MTGVLEKSRWTIPGGSGLIQVLDEGIVQRFAHFATDPSDDSSFAKLYRLDERSNKWYSSRSWRVAAKDLEYDNSLGNAGAWYANWHRGGRVLCWVYSAVERGVVNSVQLSDDPSTEVVFLGKQEPLHFVTPFPFGSEPKIWANCRRDGQQVVVLDAKLRILQRFHRTDAGSIAETLLPRYFFIDDKGNPILGVSNRTKEPKLVAAYRTEKDALIRCWHTTQHEMDVPGACVPSLGSEHMLLKQEGRLTLTRWNSSTLSFEPFWSSLDLKFESHWSSRMRTALVTTTLVVIDDMLYRLKETERPIRLKDEQIYFRAFSNANEWWGRDNKFVFRCRVQDFVGGSLSKMCVFSAAQQTLENLPDDAAREWFATAVAHFQKTPHQLIRWTNETK